MYTYKIQIAAQTNARLDDVEIGGYEFQSSEQDFSTVIVTKIVEAASLESASKLFNEQLWPILDAIAFHRYSSISAFGSSLLILRVDLKLAYFNYLVPSSLPGLHLSPRMKDYKQKVSEIEALASEKTRALDNFRLAILATTDMATAAHLLQGVESLAGKSPQPVTCNKCDNSPVRCNECDHELSFPVTDRNIMLQILGSELFEYFYKTRSDGFPIVRNAIMHGGRVNKQELGERLEPLRLQLAGALREKHAAVSMQDLSTWNQMQGYRGTKCILKWSEAEPDLKLLIHKFYPSDGSGITSETDPSLVAADKAVDAYRRMSS